MITPRCCSQFQHFNKLRAAIRQRQMPSQTVNSFNNNHSSCLKFTLHMLLLTVITITTHTITVLVTIITTTTTTAAPTEPMNIAISPVRPLELPKRKGLSTERSDLSSTKKSRKWKRRRCAGTSSCTITASTVTPAHMHTLWTSSCQNSTCHPTIRPKCAPSTMRKDTACTDRDANSFTVFMT